MEGNKQGTLNEESRNTQEVDESEQVVPSGEGSSSDDTDSVVTEYRQGLTGGDVICIVTTWSIFLLITTMGMLHRAQSCDFNA